MPAAIPIIATVAAGAAAANGAYAIAMAITIAAQVATQMMTLIPALAIPASRVSRNFRCNTVGKRVHCFIMLIPSQR